MTSPQVTDLQKPDIPDQDRTPDAPAQGSPEEAQKKAELSDDLKKELMGIPKKYKQDWLFVRRNQVMQAGKKLEFIKGNQNIAFDPYGFNWFDVNTASSLLNKNGNNGDDVNPYRYVTNAYQALEATLEGVLCADTPKVRFLPEDADEQEDIDMAKSGSLLQERYERKNRINALQKKELLYMWIGPGYWKYTRYQIDANRWDTHKEPIVELQDQEISPDRFACPSCGNETPEAELPKLAGMTCPQCGQPLSGNDFHPAEHMPMPTVVGERDVPNGMTTSTVYSILHVEMDPKAEHPRETPILDLQEEVDIAYLRSAYPDSWADLKKGSSTSGTVDGEAERLARMRVYGAFGGRNNLTGVEMPTLSRCWIQPDAFNKIDNQDIAKQLTSLFPTGCKLVTLGGDIFLEATEEKLTDHWTCCFTKDGLGGMAPGIGDPAVDLQERLNDVMNIQHQHMDSVASFTVLSNADLIDSKALNGKRIQSNTITPVKLNKMGTGTRLEDAFFQPKVSLDQQIYSYADKILFLMQFLTGMTPQTWGGAQEDLGPTYGAQRQAQQAALGKMNIYWQKMKEEHADTAQIATRIEAEAMRALNMNITMSDKKPGTDSYYNKVVRADSVQGSCQAVPETDQGFPMGYGEMKDSIEKLLEFATKSPEIFGAFFSEPTNMELVKLYALPPGSVIPGEDERAKCLRTLDQLSKEAPIQNMQPDPMTGQPVMTLEPSIEPIPEIDNFPVIQATAKHWALKNYEVAETNQPGWQNVLAYIRAAAAMDKAQQLKEMGASQAIASPPPSAQQNQPTP